MKGDCLYEEESQKLQPVSLTEGESGSVEKEADGNIVDEERLSKNSASPSCFKSLIHRVQPSQLCPRYGWHMMLLTSFLSLFLMWGVLYTVLDDMMTPTAPLFTLILLVVASYVGGVLISFLHLPPLLGMLLVGLVLRNVGYYSLSDDPVYKDVVAALRKLALLVILIKAGLGLDAGALKKLSCAVLRLAFTPCAFEATTVAIASYLILGFPWLWGFLLGCVLGAVSPAVVVPSLLSLKDRGYGEDKGISTLVIAASSIDDILAISAFGVFLGTIFSEGDLIMKIFQGPLEVVMGLSFGIAWGILSIYIPHKNDPNIAPFRVLMIGGGGVFALFGSQMIGYDGSGPLACITAAFVASYGWKKQGWSADNPVASAFSILWLIFQPILFGAIGADVLLSSIKPDFVGRGIAVLFIGLAVRVVVCCVVTLGAGLTVKERLFITISWFPKATVQAALGPVALDLVGQKNSTEDLRELASYVLTIAVVSILITAPLGAIGIALSGPKLLSKLGDGNTSKYDGKEESTNV